MGLRGYLRRRRERESALGRLELDPVCDGSIEAPGPEREAAVEEEAGGRDTAPDAERSHPAAGRSDAVELPGADPAELASMLGRALSGGTPQISTASHRTEGASGVAEEILALLAELGTPAGPDGGEGVAIAPEDAEQLLERVRARLAAIERDRQR